jgi:hypothetical protein
VTEKTADDSDDADHRRLPDHCRVARPQDERRGPRDRKTSEHSLSPNPNLTHVPSLRFEDGTTLSSVRGSTTIPAAVFSGLSGGRDMMALDGSKMAAIWPPPNRSRDRIG